MYVHLSFCLHKYTVNQPIQTHTNKNVIFNFPQNKIKKPIYDAGITTYVMVCSVYMHRIVTLGPSNNISFL